MELSKQLGGCASVEASRAIGRWGPTVLIFFLCAAVTEPSLAQTITVLNPHTVESTDQIEVRVGGVPKYDPNSKLRFWITLVNADARIGYWSQWYWVDGGEPQTFQFNSISPGNYELRLHDHWSDRSNSYDKTYAREPLEVKSPQHGNIVIDLQDPIPLLIDSPIKAEIRGLHPKLTYWITLVPSKFKDGQYSQWKDLKGSANQKVRFDGLKQGSYELRLHDYSSGYPLLARAAFSVVSHVESTTGVPSCPRTFSGRADRLTCRCSRIEEGSPAIWGTGVYTADSSICHAAVHSGAIQNPSATEEDAIITVIPKPGKERYESSLQNGLSSRSYGKWHSSFAVTATTEVVGHTASGDSTVDQLMRIEAVFKAAMSGVEIQSASRDLLGAVALVEDIDNAISLLRRFEEGPMATEAAHALFESGTELGISVAAILAEKLAGTFIDTHVSGTRGEKDSLKSFANIGIGLASGGIPAYAASSVHEITATYLKLSAEAQSYTAIQVGRAYWVAELIDSQPLANYDLERIRMEIDYLNEAASHADEVSSLWPPYQTSAVLIRSLTPILEARLQQRFDLVRHSRSDVRSAFEAFAAAHLDCRRLSATQSTGLRLALDKFAEDVKVEGWRKVSPPPGLEQSYQSCQ